MLTITLANDQREYLPGDEIRGEVAWQLDDRLVELEVHLAFLTAGRGSTDAVIVATHTIADPGLSGDEAFSFRAPIGPYSFSGTLISLSWAIEVEARGADVTAREEITIAPAGEPLQLHPVDDA